MTRPRAVFCAVLVAAAAILIVNPVVRAQSADPWVGTWKLNLAKSSYSPGPAPKSGIVKISTPPGGGISIVTDGVGADGKPTHTENVARFDEKDAVVKGAATPNSTRAFKRIDARNFEFIAKVDGKVTTTSRGTVSADGKIHTLTTTGKNAQGQTVNNTQVYERQ